MISVIISIYKDLSNLKLVLLGLSKQTFKNFEVIISEDNNSLETANFITSTRKIFNFSIKHVSQEDIGFRKTRILNKALLISEGKYLVFLDGDCIPHKRLLESYYNNLTPNTVCMGRRCYLDKNITEKLRKQFDLKKINLFNLLFHSNRLELGIYNPYLKTGSPKRMILGCNWAVSRQVLLDINGFDEDYVHAGVGEDHDIDWRLRLKNIIFKNIKHQVIVYHLYHKPNYSSETTAFVNNQKDDKIKIGNIFCINGVIK